jgi:hypothetical protein
MREAKARGQGVIIRLRSLHVPTVFPHVSCGIAGIANSLSMTLLVFLGCSCSFSSLKYDQRLHAQHSVSWLCMIENMAWQQGFKHTMAVQATRSWR